MYQAIWYALCQYKHMKISQKCFAWAKVTGPTIILSVLLDLSASSRARQGRVAGSANNCGRTMNT